MAYGTPDKNKDPLSVGQAGLDDLETSYRLLLGSGLLDRNLDLGLLAFDVGFAALSLDDLSQLLTHIFVISCV